MNISDTGKNEDTPKTRGSTRLAYDIFSRFERGNHTMVRENWMIIVKGFELMVGGVQDTPTRLNVKNHL